MSVSPLIGKSKTFALETIKVCNEVKASKRESVLTNQLIRSGTSIGANIREAFYAHSEYWLELLIEGGYCADKAVLEHCSELKRLLIASLNTAKGKQQP